MMKEVKEIQVAEEEEEVSSLKIISRLEKAKEILSSKKGVYCTTKCHNLRNRHKTWEKDSNVKDNSKCTLSSVE